MPKSVQLLLTETVENLGIVGDVVNVRSGYARNFLLPRQLATAPSEEMIRGLASKRAEAERYIGEIREKRRDAVSKMQGVEIKIERSCNDQGILYGAVTQPDIAAALVALGFDVRPKDVRLAHSIKRVDTYDVHVKYEADLEAIVKVVVSADRKIDAEERQDMEFDSEGNLIDPTTSRGRRIIEEESREKGRSRRFGGSGDLIPPEAQTVVKGWGSAKKPDQPAPDAKPEPAPKAKAKEPKAEKPAKGKSKGKKKD